jgi:Papain family cysteine protease
MLARGLSELRGADHQSLRPSLRGVRTRIEEEIMKYKLMLLGFLAVLAACATPNSSTPPAPDPFFKSEDAIGKTAPEGAQTITPEEFKRRVAAGEGQVISKANFEAIKKVDDALLLEDQRFLQPILDAHPEYGIRIVSPSAEDLNTDGDRSAEAEGPRTLLGRRWQIAQAASNLRTFPSLGNQRRIYSEFFPEFQQALSLEDISTVDYPSATSIQSATLEDARLANNLLMETAVSQYRKIADRVVVPVQTAPSDPTLEVGVGQQLDRTKNCSKVPSPNSVFGQFTWPLKKFTTSVKDQGMRGTCWAFATVANLEIEITRKTGVKVNLSEQDYAANRFVRFNPRLDADGGDPQTIADRAYAANFEFALENTLQYNTSLQRAAKTKTLIGGPQAGSFMDSFFTGSCENYPLAPCSDTTAQGPIVCTPPLGLGFVYCLSGLAPVSSRSGYRFSQAPRELWDISNPDYSTSILAVRAALGRPFALTHAVTDDPKTLGNDQLNFRPDPRGFLTYDNKGPVRTGDHVVTVVGFITQEKMQTKLDPPAGSSGNGFFIIKNSWGHCWGDGGFAYVDFDWVKNYAVQAIEIR